jgi:hypothetical protein
MTITKNDFEKYHGVCDVMNVCEWSEWEYIAELADLPKSKAKYIKEHYAELVNRFKTAD